MHYDRDLKLRRGITITLVTMNGVLAAVNFLARHWLIALTACAWVATCSWELFLLRAQQCFRESARIVEAGVRAIEERSRR